MLINVWCLSGSNITDIISTMVSSDSRHDLCIFIIQKVRHDCHIFYQDFWSNIQKIKVGLLLMAAVSLPELKKPTPYCWHFSLYFCGSHLYSNTFSFTLIFDNWFHCWHNSNIFSFYISCFGHYGTLITPDSTFLPL